MSGVLVAIGVLLIITLLVHLLFRIVKLTIIIFLFGMFHVAIDHILKQYFGIDLIGLITNHL